MEPHRQELVTRYKRMYYIPDEAPITEEMVLDHWELEKRLTKELLASNPENRRDVFERCYTELFDRLKWINEYVETDDGLRQTIRFQNWHAIIGSSPKTIYEIGSGKGELISYLAAQGFHCKATEITRQRGQKFIERTDSLSWGVTDGVHLDRFEKPGSYEVVISASVIEHLHPDDLLTHFRSAWHILSPGGKYIFTAPHRCAGPADISAVFRCDEPMGMHLHEFTYGELTRISREAGFSQISAVMALPARFTNALTRRIRPMDSPLYLRYLCAIESILLLLPPSPIRRKITRLSRALLFEPVIFMVAGKV